MSLQVKKGTWTGNNTSPQGISGLGFQPKALICWATGPGATDAITANAILTIGVEGAIADGAQALAMAYTDNVATSARNGATDTVLLRVPTTSGTDYTVTLDSYDSDGFTVSYSSAANANGDVFHFIAIGGADLTDAKQGGFNIPTSGATFDVTSVGFQPDAGIFIHSSASGIGVGLLDTAGHECCAQVAFTSGDTMTSSMNNNGFFSQDSCLVILTDNADTVDAQANFASWLSNGARFNLTNAATVNTPVIALWLKGGQYVVGSEAKSAVSGADSFAVAGITPLAALLIAGDGVTANNTVTVATAGIGIGGASSTDGANEGCAITVIAEAINTQADRMQSTTRSFAFLTAGASSTLQTAADMTAFGSGTFELTWTANGTAELVGFMGFASSPVLTKAPPPTIFRHPRYSIGRRYA